MSLPDREYQLAGRLMADAIAESAETGTPVIGALHRLAHVLRTAPWQRSSRWSPTAHRRVRRWTWRSKLSPRTATQPRPDDGRIIMANCPFHALAQAQTQLVCQMNNALIIWSCRGAGTASAGH